MSYVNIATNRCKERIVRHGSWWPPDLMSHCDFFLNGPRHYFSLLVIDFLSAQTLLYNNLGMHLVEIWEKYFDPTYTILVAWPGG